MSDEENLTKYYREVIDSKDEEIEDLQKDLNYILENNKRLLAECRMWEADYERVFKDLEKERELSNSQLEKFQSYMGQSGAEKDFTKIESFMVIAIIILAIEAVKMAWSTWS